MKLVKQSYEILEQEIPKYSNVFKKEYSDNYIEDYISNMYKHIERCGRICYKSERLISYDSAKRFVEGLIKTKHYSVLEHGVIYLEFKKSYTDKPTDEIIGYEKYISNPYSKVNTIVKDWSTYYFITTNYRVIVENEWYNDLQYLCEPTEYHELRHTVLLHGCIHTYKDLTRHRKASFSIESTRYCNYSKTNKFGEMKFVLPPWMNNIKWYIKLSFKTYLKFTEYIYNFLTKHGWQPQQAAEILPQCTAADIAMTAFDSDWKFIFDLRSDTALTGKPHPLVEELMTPLRDEFKEKRWI